MARTALARPAKQTLSKYDPEKGLKKIALLEGVEKHFARAKDATKLREAIRAKLQAQSEYATWWYTQAEKDKGGRPRKTSGRSVGGFVKAGLNGLPEEHVARRWNKKLNGSPEQFETAVETRHARYVKLVEFEQGAHVGQNSGENEWYTPAEYIEAARAVLGDIDLDPASTPAANEIVKASQIFTLEESGLDQPWHGRVWMNPPYSQPTIEHFCEKFAHHAERGDINGIALVNNATETTWFQRLASGSMCLCFPKGRIRFWSPRGESATPLQGQAVLYTGADTARFSEAFRRFGFIVERTA